MKIRIFFSIFVALGISISSCKKPDSTLGEAKKADTTLSAIVVFSVGESRISHSDGTEEKARLGVVVKTGDRIETGPKGKVDLQFPNGSAIRIAPQTILDFAKLSMNTQGGVDTQLALAGGKVFADVKKAKKTDGFSVVTPTAIAGVRGTSFIVESNPKTGKARVKVLEGSVAASPRIPAIDLVSVEQVEADESLKRLVDSIQKVEVVLEEGQEAILNAKKDKLNIPVLDSLDANQLIPVVEKEKPILGVANFTKSEEQEIRTIVRLDEDTARELIALNEKSLNTDSAEKLAEIERKKQDIEEKMAAKQEEKKREFEAMLAANPRDLKSNKEIVNYYERIEKIILSDGSSIIGAIVNQEANTMIVHTEKGIQRINLDDVDVVIYDFQTKAKF